jgi:hypothetical protein
MMSVLKIPGACLAAAWDAVLDGCSVADGAMAN